MSEAKNGPDRRLGGGGGGGAGMAPVRYRGAL